MTTFSDDDMQARLNAMSAEERRAWAERVGEDVDELAAYLHLYDALEEEPPGALPPDFAETTARRAFARQQAAASHGVTSSRAWYEHAWVEHVALAALLVVATAGAFFLTPGGFGLESLSFSLDSFAALRQLWQQARADLLAAAALAVLVLILFDRLVPAFRTSERRPRTAVVGDADRFS